MRMYDELASWFPLITPPADYLDEAAHILALARAACDRPPRSLLELGCGGGNNASHLKHDLDCTLTDLSAEMLAISRALNPECEHRQGDMRDLRLGRQFDVVLAHDAICYMLTESDLEAAIRTAADHLAPGGVAILIPDAVTEIFRPSTRHGGVDATDGRALRYLEWTRERDPDNTYYDVDFAFLLTEPGRPVRVEHDHHRFGLFPRATWHGLIEAAALELVAPDVPDPNAGQYPIFVAHKPQ